MAGDTPKSGKDKTMEELIEESSLGTDEAVAHRNNTSDGAVEEVMQRAGIRKKPKK